MLAALAAVPTIALLSKLLLENSVFVIEDSC
jgi:hypothetical protein